MDDSISLGDVRRPKSISDVTEQAKRINLHDYIISLPGRYQASLGQLAEGGHDLSGGQWQRVAIARAMYRKNAQMLVLDEPTASLDPISEARIYEDFTQIASGRTTVLISHRLGVTRLVDRILVFQAGSVIEEGTHSELMEAGGLYAEMFNKQAAWYA